METINKRKNLYSKFYSKLINIIIYNIYRLFMTFDNHKYILYELYAIRGDIKHYFHFFFAVMIPLILEYIEYKKKYEHVTFIIKNDVGPFFRILFELPIDIKLQNFLINNDDLNIEKKYLIPMDTQVMNAKSLAWIKMKRASIFTHDLSKKINSWFNEQVTKYNFYVYPQNYIIDILIIERKTNISYKSLYSKKIKVNQIFKTSGSDRRYIINHKKFVESIKNYFPKKNVLNISTEYMPIFEQYYVFNNSKLVIGQHGASLANIIFMKNKCSVIEIMCKDRLKENWFLDLSKSCNNLNYVQYLTDEESVNIDLEDFKIFLDKNIKI